MIEIGWSKASLLEELGVYPGEADDNVDAFYFRVAPINSVVSTCAYPGSYEIGWGDNFERALRSNLDSELSRIRASTKACPYCGTTAHRMHEFRGREVCSGCGSFWVA